MIGFFNTTGFLRFVFATYLSVASLATSRQVGSRMRLLIRRPDLDTLSELPKTVLLMTNFACMSYCVFMMMVTLLSETPWR